VFVPGVELSGRLYREAVRPLLTEHFPAPAHTAALIGYGSEVLGFDTVRSTDHNWGPRLLLFLPPDDLAVARLLAERLPASGVEVVSLDAWLTGHLGFSPLGEIATLDWLATPTQVLAEVTAGAVFHDDLGLHSVRQRLAWYPDDVWRYVLACQWQRVSQEEAFVGRCGEVGDELGSAVVAACLARDLMRLCLLMNRTYPPYSKWLGSAFARLPCAARLTPVLTAALAATDWHTREDQLAVAYETVATLHNETGLTEPVDPRTRDYHSRPFRVLHAERFTAALAATIRDPAVRDLPLTGAVDQFVDSTDALADRARTRRLVG
jgi:hypothetical protein